MSHTQVKFNGRRRRIGGKMFARKDRPRSTALAVILASRSRSVISYTAWEGARNEESGGMQVRVVDNCIDSESAGKMRSGRGWRAHRKEQGQRQQRPATGAKSVHASHFPQACSGVWLHYAGCRSDLLGCVARNDDGGVCPSSSGDRAEEADRGRLSVQSLCSVLGSGLSPATSRILVNLPLSGMVTTQSHLIEICVR